MIDSSKVLTGRRSSLERLMVLVMMKLGMSRRRTGEFTTDIFYISFILCSRRYNGRITDPPEIFSPEMEQACQIVERIVSSELRKRSSSRYALEWAGGDTGSANDLLWRANVAASNRYEGRNDSVGWHSDHLTYLGPYCTIGMRQPLC